VKTRLAAAVGAGAAAAVYRRVGRRVVRAAASTRRTTVWYAPRGLRATVSVWLRHIAGLEYRAQPAGDLGFRLAAAFRWHFSRGAKRVVVVGTDCPGVGRSVLLRAFRALRSADLVLGPALDGGYYLVGLAAPCPQLFEDIPWSSDQVFRASRDRARALGRSCRVLERLRDVDTVRDAAALGLLAALASRGES
jgi:rSAM/selenodomain-associated transferase 1